MNDSGTSGSNCAETVPAKAVTLRALINAYQTDKVSTYQKLRYHVRRNHDTLLRRLADQYGARELGTIKARDLKAWHMEWSAGKLISVTWGPRRSRMGNCDAISK